MTRVWLELQALKRQFDAVHAAGLAALNRGDLRAAGEAIRRERAIILEHGELLRLLSDPSRTSPAAPSPRSAAPMEQSQTPGAAGVRCPSCTGKARAHAVSLQHQERTISYACDACQHRWAVTSPENNALFRPPQT